MDGLYQPLTQAERRNLIAAWPERDHVRERAHFEANLRRKLDRARTRTPLKFSCVITVTQLPVDPR